MISPHANQVAPVARAAAHPSPVSSAICGAVVRDAWRIRFPSEGEPTASARAAVVTSGSFGGYAYRLFIPSSYAAGRATPLVVMLHGCTQTPDQFAQSTQMDALAESAGFLVAIPSSRRVPTPYAASAGSSQHIRAAALASPRSSPGIVGQIGGRYTVDSDRVFAAGFSAGRAWR